MNLVVECPSETMPTYTCPTCGKSITVTRKEEAPYRPFCCERCKLVDLGRWLDGTYVIHEPDRAESTRCKIGDRSRLCFERAAILVNTR